MTHSTKAADSSWIMTALAAMWLALFPFWQDGSFSRITHSKWVGMLVLTGVTLVVCVHMALSLLRCREHGCLRIGAVQCIALGYFALVALSALFGSWQDILNDSGQVTVLWGARRYEGLATQLCYGAIFLCMSLTPPRLERVMDAAADGLLIFCGITALQYAGVNVLELFPAGRSILTNYEFQGTIGNIDMVVGYVSIVMPLLLCGFALRGSWLWLVSGTAGVLLMLCMEVQSGLIVTAATLFALVLLSLVKPAVRSRTMVVWGGALLMISVRMMLRLPWLDGVETLSFDFTWPALGAALASLAMMAPAYPVSRHPGRKLPGWTVPVTVVVLCILALLAVYFAPLPRGNGLWELQEILHGRARDSFGSERIGIWRVTLEMSADSLLFGTGPDTFLYAMDDYLLQTGQTLTQRFDNPHNMLLAILSNNGLPAMLAFIALCAAVLALALRRAEQEPMLLPAALAVACYLLQGMFTFSLCLVTPMFWAMLGVTAAMANAVPTPARKGKTTDEPHVPDDLLL